MACPDTSSSSLPRNSCASIPHGLFPHGPFPYSIPHSNPGTRHYGYVQIPQDSCLASFEQINTLSSRIAVLEEQLANARAEKESADTSNRYLLRLLSSGSLITGLNSTSAEEVPKLRHKLLVSKIKKNHLKAELQKALIIRDLPTQWSGQCCRTQASFALSDSSATVIEGPPTTSAKQTELHLLDSIGPIAHPLIDLGFEAASSAEGTPELEQCDGYSSVSDDSEELSCNPSGTRQRTHLWDHGVAKQYNVNPVEIFPEESSYMRHFLCGSVKDNTVSSIQANVKIQSGEASLFSIEPVPSALRTSNDIRLTTLSSHVPTATEIRAKTPCLDSREPATSSLETSSQADKTGLRRSGSRARALGLNESTWHPRFTDRPAAAHGGLTWGSDKLFASAQERQVAISTHKHGVGPTDITFPDIFRYGICYNPGSSVRDVYRTVLISGLASTVTMTTLLEKVRGGVVVSAKLLDTTTITGAYTALITFLHEKAAMLFEDYAIQHHLSFAGHKVKVELLSKPTWPTPIPLQKAIYDHGHTRCLTIRNFPRNISPEALRRDLHLCSVMVTDRIESMNMGTDGVLELRFESIWTAGKAYGILTSWRVYRQCKVNFSPDPCAQTLDTLNKQTDPASNSTQLKSSKAEEPQTLPAESPGGNDDESEKMVEEHLASSSTEGTEISAKKNTTTGV